MTSAAPGYDTGPTPGASAQLKWGSCGQTLRSPTDVPTAQCGSLAVPVDYNNPGGAQVQLAVIRIPATGPRIGSLLVNPGGPGASAVDMVAAMGPGLAGSEVSRRFDLVGFDPRGVGHSTPALRCQSDADFDAFRREPMVDYSPAGVAHIEQVYRQVAQRCLARNGQAFLENIGTADVTRDMDAVRQALGDDQINYLGFSYGTELGTAYVERFGEHVRSMVLDGAIDPSIGPIDQTVNQEAGFQTAFNDYAADCARSADCPLGTDPAQWVNRYHQLIDPLVTKPAVTSDPRGLGYSDATTGTFNALYTPQFWKFLTSGLLGSAARHRPRGPVDAGRRVLRSRLPRALQQLSGRLQRGPLRRRARSPPIRRHGPTPIGAFVRSRHSCPTGSSPGTRLAICARSGRCRRRRRHIRRRLPRPEKSSSCPPLTTRPPRIRPVSTWPANSARN